MLQCTQKYVYCTAVPVPIEYLKREIKYRNQRKCCSDIHTSTYGLTYQLRSLVASNLSNFPLKIDTVLIIPFREVYKHSLHDEEYDCQCL